MVDLEGYGWCDKLPGVHAEGLNPYYREREGGQ
jgi:hypothetical protein